MGIGVKNCLVIALATALTAGIVACGGGGGGGDTGTTAEQYQVSEATGGNFLYTSPDNPNILVSLSFAAGAVSADTTITVDTNSAAYDSNVIPGLGFEFAPDGLAFAATVTLVVTYDEAALGGADESELKIHKWTGAGWQELASVVDPDINTVTAILSGFSEYFVFPAMAAAGQKLYFSADDGTSGWELWSWDGSDLTLETDINAPEATVSPQMLKVFNNKIYFVTGALFNELWTYDGAVAAPIEEVASANLQVIGNGGGSRTWGLMEYNNKLYFNAKNSSFIWELFSYSEASGLTQETDTSGSTTFMPQAYMVHDGKIYFEGGEGSNNRELYVFDGVNAPEIAAEINSAGSSQPDWMTSFNGTLYLVADDGIHGRELWAYSSTSGSAYMVTDINPGSGDGILIPGGLATDGANKFVPYNGKLYFGARSSDADAIHLWATDGTTLGTTLVSDIVDLPGSGSSSESRPAVLDGKLYFYASGTYETTDWTGLWVYDTADETTPRPIPGQWQGQYDLMTFDGRLYFKGWDPETGGFAGLVSSDGINEPVMEAYFSTNLLDSQLFSLSDSALY